MLKAIIFDMDGVIIDSEPQHARAALQVFEQNGVHTDIDYCNSFIGSTTKHMAEVSVKKFHMNITAEELLEQNNKAKAALAAQEGYIPIPGVTELLEELHRNNIQLAIASSSSHREIEHVVKSLGIHKYFDKLVSGTQVDRPKPAPDIFQLTLKKLGVSSKEALVIEDSQNGTEAAVAAGITAVGYLNPHSGNQSLSSASVILSSMEGLNTAFFENVLRRSLGKPITIASTRRLLIRELAQDDIDDMYQIFQDPKIREFVDNIDDYKQAEQDKLQAYIKNVYSFYGYGLWGVFSKTTHGLIGRCGIENQMIDGKEEIMLSYLLDSQHWGYGYAIECCEAVLAYAREELDIDRIVAVIDKRNVRSIHTAQKLGMKPEKELVYRGRDSVLYVK